MLITVQSGPQSPAALMAPPLAPPPQKPQLQRWQRYSGVLTAPKGVLALCSKGPPPSPSPAAIPAGPLPYLAPPPPAVWNAGRAWTEDGALVPSTLAMMVNTVIIAKCARAEDIFTWVSNATAIVLIILIDTGVFRSLARRDEDPVAAVAAYLLYQSVFDAVDTMNGTGNGAHWHRVDLTGPSGEGVGIVLARCKTIAEAAVADNGHGNEHLFFILQLRLVQSAKNPGAELAFAVFARHQYRRQPWDAPWSPRSFVLSAVESVHNHNVRLMRGVFDIPRLQFAAFCRSCGASYQRPFAVSFRAGPWLDPALHLGEWVVHPNYVVPIGPCDLRTATYIDTEPPELPGWMVSVKDSLIARSWVVERFMPTWQEVPNRSSGLRERRQLAALPPLGKVTQKKLDTAVFAQHWAHGIHQDLVFLGQGRPGERSARQWKEKQARPWRKPRRRGQEPQLRTD